jgi:hypothetical protein
VELLIARKDFEEAERFLELFHEPPIKKR